MEKLTYASYCKNPAIREQLDADVRRLRSEAVLEFIVRPLARLGPSLYDRARAALATRHAKSA